MIEVRRRRPPRHDDHHHLRPRGPRPRPHSHGGRPLGNRDLRLRCARPYRLCNRLVRYRNALSLRNRLNGGPRDSHDDPRVRHGLRRDQHDHLLCRRAHQGNASQRHRQDGLRIRPELDKDLRRPCGSRLPALELFLRRCTRSHHLRDPSRLPRRTPRHLQRVQHREPARRHAILCGARHLFTFTCNLQSQIDI